MIPDGHAAQDLRASADIHMTADPRRASASRSQCNLLKYKTIWPNDRSRMDHDAAWMRKR